MKEQAIHGRIFKRRYRNRHFAFVRLSICPEGASDGCTNRRHPPCGDQAEIAAGQIAVRRTQSRSVQFCASRMVDEHGQANLETAGLMQKDSRRLDNEVGLAMR
ncbi:DUF4142 domain-containing protein [Paraburkholderia caledonica]|uniref:DUF4142 domain-containing protein n=1 Tax=Paraburkholderia caledonica TaxID=134536 RepID=UPI001FC8A4AC|nr:DUF4142 domain-containing protein [Paraburkholderia caledonica]